MRAAALCLVDFRAPPRPAEPQAPAPPARDPAAEAAAFQQGYAAGRAAARAEAEQFCAKALADGEVRAMERLAEAREDWTACESGVLLARLDEGLTALEERLADALAAILADRLDAARRRETIDALVARIGDLGREGLRIELRGAADLVEATAARLPADARVERHVDDAPDLRVAIGDTILETRLAAWRADVDAALAKETDG